MTQPLLRTIKPSELSVSRRDPLDADTLTKARAIVDDVAARGEVALREHAERLGDIEPGAPLVVERSALQQALSSIDPAERDVLERTAERIKHFALAQRAAVDDISVAVPSGRAGHKVIAVEAAGCYAPGGRFPLPSTVLMTAVTARVAGVSRVWVASPRPAQATLAAAAVAGADAMLAVGGAQAIAALAFGVGPTPRCDAVVGPGNRWVTAAKQLVAGRVAIDMLAGPSELVVLADETADPQMIAADLLAQAEHDPDALPILVTTSAALIERVNAALPQQLSDLPTAETASASLAGGFAVLVDDLAAAIAVCDEMAPEHLQVLTRGAADVAQKLRHYGGLFIGDQSAEVFGDYGVGPNHTLPTSGTARFVGGLSVLNFVRIATWLELDATADTPELIADAARLARMEGLEAHARAAERRRT